MDIFDLLKLGATLVEDPRTTHSNFSNINRSIPQRRTRAQKEGSRHIERSLKKNLPFLGNAMEVLNNLTDSVENVSDAMDPFNRISHAVNDLSVAEALEVFCTGDHIATMRTAYSHHGIYDGCGGVYEYDDSCVRHISLRTFANGDRLYRVNEGTIYDPDEIIYRAESRLGEDEYNIFFNNCENFATWCRLGEEIY